MLEGLTHLDTVYIGSMRVLGAHTITLGLTAASNLRTLRLDGLGLTRFF